MHSLEIKDKVEFADVAEEAVERFDKDLDEVEEGERGFRGGGDEDEVEGCVVAVCDLRGGVAVVLVGGWCGLGGWGGGGRGGEERGETIGGG